MNSQLWLAPMEGVVDFIMRDFLTQFGGIDQCVTEFIRVVDQPITDAVFLRECPELKNERKTKSGVPVTVQLLGSDVEWLANNALRAVALGAREIDLNFGCPAKTVNRHDGGATLLKSAERLFKITSEVRRRLPSEIPLSAKMRLGFENPKDCLENSLALEAAGISHLTVHGRTKVQMYAPSADWDWIAKIKSQLKIPVIANGDIFTVEDFQKCQKITGCDGYMIGRGALRDPLIFSRIKGLVKENAELPGEKILEFYQTNHQVSPLFAQARTKQWLKNLILHRPQWSPAFDEIKRINHPLQFEEKIRELMVHG